MNDSNSTLATFSKPFIDAAKKVFETMIFTKLDPMKPYVKTNLHTSGDVSAVLGVYGEIKRGDVMKKYIGMLVLSWNYESYVKTASAMLMQEFKEYGPEISDVGGEICNIIMGNAKRDLSSLGHTTNMAIPSMVEGKGHNIKYPPRTVVIVIPFKSAHGDMFMELCYREE